MKTAHEAETQERAFLEAGKGAPEQWAEVIDFKVYLGPDRVSGGKPPAPYDIEADITGEWNDAYILGPEPGGLAKFLNTTATFLLGEMWGAKHPRNTQDGKWVAETKTWGDWIHALTHHLESKHKAGSCVVLGSSVEGARKAASMDEMFALGLDIDSGAKLDDVVTTIRRLNLMAIIYTTHSHGKAGISLKRDEVMRKLGIETAPTLDDVKTFLRDHDKSRYEENFIEAITIADPRMQTGKGVMIALNTPTLDKYRIVFPMAEAVKLIDLAPTHTAALEVWEDKITGMAWEALGVHFDTSCTDPSRLYYAPRHPKDGEWECFLLWGEPLRFEDVPTMKKSEYTRNRTTTAKARQYTESGVDLNDWYNANAEGFEFADFLETMAPDKVRRQISDGMVSFGCPFSHEHSSDDPDSTKFAVVNASASDKGRGTAFCKGDACQDRGNAAFLAEMLHQGWFTEEDLFDEDGMHLMPPGEEVEDAGPATRRGGKTASEEAPNRAKLAQGRKEKAAKDAAEEAADAEPLTEGDPFLTLDITAPLPSSPKKAVAALEHRFKYVNAGGKGAFLRVADYRVEGVEMEFWPTAPLKEYHQDRLVKHKGKEVNPVDLMIRSAKRYSKVVFAPHPVKTAEGSYNLFRGFSLEPVPGDCTSLKDFLRDIICAGDADAFKWLWLWLAHRVQRPGEKPGTSIVMHGRGGIGKGTFGVMLQRLFAPYYISVDSDEQILGTHAGTRFLTTLVCFAEEALFSGDRKGSNTLKSRISKLTVNVNPKYLSEFEAPNYTGYVIDGNDFDIVRVENNGSERRWFVTHVSDIRHGDKAFWNRMYRDIDGPAMQALMHELMTYDPAEDGLTWSDVRTAPDTMARRRMSYYSLEKVEREWMVALDEGTFEFRDKDGAVLRYRLDEDDKKETRVGSEHLRAFLAPHVNKHDGGQDDPAKVFDKMFSGRLSLRKGKGKVPVYVGDKTTPEGRNLNYFEFPPLSEIHEVMKDMGFRDGAEWVEDAPEK